MDNIDLNKVSSTLLYLSFSLNRIIFNNPELTKGLTIPPSHVRVIFCLDHNGPMSISEIAKKLSIYKPNMTPILDKLIQEGFIVRCEDPKDRRILRITLTEKAHDFIKIQKRKLEEIFQNKIGDLSKEDLATLIKASSELNNIIVKLK
ncbi:MAG: MarR family transcriptional regulator [Clostridium perfringens]|nr:MarR family transcriptional regulator [Clostridium perfringens]